MMIAFIEGYKDKTKKERINGETKIYGTTFFELRNFNTLFDLFAVTVISGDVFFEVGNM